MSPKCLLLLCAVFICGLIEIRAEQQSYEDARCMCTCTTINGTQKYKKSIVTPVTANNNCDGVAVAPTGSLKNASEELCPRCECIYESRNTGIIKVVVAIVIWIITVLVIYMFFLLCLDPLLNKRTKSNYVEHTNEEPQEEEEESRLTRWVYAAMCSTEWDISRTSGSGKSKSRDVTFTTGTQCLTSPSPAYDNSQDRLSQQEVQLGKLVHII